MAISKSKAGIRHRPRRGASRSMRSDASSSFSCGMECPWLPERCWSLVSLSCGGFGKGTGECCNGVTSGSARFRFITVRNPSLRSSRPGNSVECQRGRMTNVMGRFRVVKLYDETLLLSHLKKGSAIKLERQSILVNATEDDASMLKQVWPFRLGSSQESNV